MVAEQYGVGLMEAGFDFGGPGATGDIGLQHGTPQEIENQGADADDGQHPDFHEGTFHSDRLEV
jgi:hypothetical protein